MAKQTRFGGSVFFGHFGKFVQVVPPNGSGGFYRFLLYSRIINAR
jgi:hypothetical protein